MNLKNMKTDQTLAVWFKGHGIDLEPGEGIEEAIDRVIAMAEGIGTEPRRAIWTDADYLVAILAIFTGPSRARQAALAEFARRPVEDG
jgi:hypothetical protein